MAQLTGWLRGPRALAMPCGCDLREASSLGCRGKSPAGRCCVGHCGGHSWEGASAVAFHCKIAKEVPRNAAGCRTQGRPVLQGQDAGGAAILSSSALEKALCARGVLLQCPSSALCWQSVTVPAGKGDLFIGPSPFHRAGKQRWTWSWNAINWSLAQPPSSFLCGQKSSDDNTWQRPHKKITDQYAAWS